ncbi:MAG: iron-sulfur cluster assembly scaffold protein [Acidobacteria bacterium]|nr:iron-sulfur cluster assembly scaffold protein [Acidobacteriota bacterium]
MDSEDCGKNALPEPFVFRRLMDSEPYYSDKLLDHYQNPRNVGVLPEADGEAQRENQVCGDVLQMFVKLHGDTVKEIRFKAEGCIPTIALASYATEWATGKKIGEVRKLSPAILSAVLGELPQHKLHAALLVAETLQAALADSADS